MRFKVLGKPVIVVNGEFTQVRLSKAGGSAGKVEKGSMPHFNVARDAGKSGKVTNGLLVQSKFFKKEKLLSCSCVSWFSTQLRVTIPGGKEGNEVNEL